MKIFWLLISLYLTSAFASGHSAKMDTAVYDYFQVYKKRYIISEQRNQYRVATDKTDTRRTVSEGQGYGMLIVALMADRDRDAQRIFDGLWRFSRAHISPLSNHLMSWEVPEKSKGNDSAFDGDADIAYALIVADHVWGSSGAINYKKEALNVIEAIWKYTIGPQSHLPLLGDWVAHSGKKYNQYTVRTSDFMPGHFRAFYRFTGDAKWLRVVKATQDAILDVQHPKTGLVPDFIGYDQKKKHYVAVKEGFLEHHDGAYYYNACRVPFRIGIDALLNNDLRSKEIVQRISNWVERTSQSDPLKIKSGFKLDGTVIGDYFSIVFTAPFGVAAMSADKVWASKIYDEVKKRHENYYEDSVALLSMMAMSGRFIDPTLKR